MTKQMMRRHRYTKTPAGPCICKEWHKDAVSGEMVGTWPIGGEENFSKITKTWFEKDSNVRVLIFENVAMDSAGMGNLVFVPWWKKDGEPTLKVGYDRLPDNWSPTGIGWKYILQEIVTDPKLFHLE